MPIFVSVFDHWLTLEEVNSCETLFYRVAVEAGKAEEYMVGERRFLSFYRALAQDGAYVRKGKRIWLTEADDPAFIAILENSLRETTVYTLMNTYFIGPAVFARGGWDRTDLLLMRSKLALAALEPIAREHGVYLLSADHLA